MLFGPTDLIGFREDIIFCIWYLFVRPGKKEFWFGSFEKFEKCLCEWLMLIFDFLAIDVK